MCIRDSCKSANLELIKKHDFVLTPGRYVGAAALEDDGVPFEERIGKLTKTLHGQISKSEHLNTEIFKNFGVIEK